MRCLLVAVGLLIAGTAFAQPMLRSPQPGDVYREYVRTMSVNTSEWRVTDPDAPYFNGDSSSGNNPYNFLPNPSLDLQVDDLSGATRAEAVIDLWGGHPGTFGKQLRFNGHGWIDIPELSGANGIPEGNSGECYTQQLNPVVSIPLSDLKVGRNTFEGRNAGQTCFSFGWGQHGWYGLKLRIYYGIGKSHPTGSITSPSAGSVLGNNPAITVDAFSLAGIDRVDVLASYEDYDADGDGVYSGWQEHYHVLSGDFGMPLHGNVGSTSTAPYTVTWNTRWVPDQPAGSIKLVARILDRNGVWFVTDEVAGLSLSRPGLVVRFYRPEGVPESFWVRDGQVKSSTFTIPATDTLEHAEAAQLHIRTWNGINGAGDPPGHYTKVNDWETPEYGQNHFFSVDTISLPVGALIQGANTVELSSNTAHHGVEILWPGPGVTVRYATGNLTAVTSRKPGNSYYLEQNYPNPFNPATSIAFGLPTAGRVRLVVVNSLGQVVATPVEGYLSAGPHTISFHAAALPSGVYFYTLYSGSGRITKSMIVVR